MKVCCFVDHHPVFYVETHFEKNMFNVLSVLSDSFENFSFDVVDFGDEEEIDKGVGVGEISDFYDS